MRRTATLFLLLLASAASGMAQITLTPAFPNLNFSGPIDLQHAGDGSNRLFVVEQAGIIRVFENTPNVPSHSVFLDIRSRVLTGGELGLLGLAFDPDYENNGYFYLNYTAPSPRRSVIVRYKVSSDPMVADPNSELVLLTVEQPYDNHNGGQVAFGPDGNLYIAFGDGGSGGDPQNHGQNTKSLLGKILRIDVRTPSGERNYSIPEGNPFRGNTEGHKEEIYAYGLRNPWRFSFDFPTGRLWCGDVGQGNWEEVDTIVAGGNYGWRIMEGFHCYRPSSGCDTTGLKMPVWEYPHDTTGGQSISGGYVYRGPGVPELTGRYIYGDFGSGKIWGLSVDGGTVVNSLIRDTDFGITSFGVDKDNELYVVTFNGRKIYRLTGTSGVERQHGSTGAQLGHATPNPASGMMAIPFTLGRPMHLVLTLHDVMGREVATLLDGLHPAGEHQATLDAGTLPTGTYYCRLSAGGTVQTERIVVAR